MEKRQSREVVKAQERPSRTPLGTRNILTSPRRPGYHRVWVSDSPSIRDGMPAFEAAGYTFVEETMQVGDNSVNSGEPVVSRVTRPGGAGVTLYLMEILEEYYQADQKAAEDKIRDHEREMFSPQSIQGGYGSAAQRVKTGQGSDNTPEGF